jgi:glyoxylase-like metal-dependent hydrolase (beta-lactamase superfamily II)
VQLRTWGVAHTRSDQVVFLPEERILFTGDLVEERIFPIYPYFPPDDADVDGDRWIEVLGRLEELNPAVVVPGHGAVGDMGVIEAAREYHQLLREETLNLAAEGLDVDEVVARLEPEFLARYPDWEQPEWIAFGIRSFHARRES